MVCRYVCQYRVSKLQEYQKCEYIGLTTRPFRKRVAEHKRYVKSNILDTLLETILFNLNTTFLTWQDYYWKKWKAQSLL